MRIFIVVMLVNLVAPIRSNIITGMKVVDMEQVGKVAWQHFRALKTPCEVYNISVNLYNFAGTSFP